MSTAVLVALLAGAGTVLVLRRGALRLVVGFVLLGHAASVLVLSAGGGGRAVPLVGRAAAGGGSFADPLPHAFVLTAVVIAFAITVHLLGVLRAEGSAAEDDEDDAAVEAGLGGPDAEAVPPTAHGDAAGHAGPEGAGGPR